MTLVSSKQDMLETYCHCQLISCPCCQKWVYQVGREAKIKGFNNLYSFFPLFYHLSRSICFSLGKFKLFILTSSYNLLSKGFYFGLWELLNPLFWDQHGLTWKKKEIKKHFSCKQTGLFLVFQLWIIFLPVVIRWRVQFKGKGKTLFHKGQLFLGWGILASIFTKGQR